MNSIMSCAEHTYPPRDWVPIDLSGGDVEATMLGFTPRSLRANSAGTIVARFMDTPPGDPDRVLQVQAGEVIGGFVSVIRSSSDASLHAAR